MRSPHSLAPSQDRASRYFDDVPRLIEFSYGELMREIKVRRLQFQSPLVHHILQEKFRLDTKWPNHERHVLIGLGSLYMRSTGCPVRSGLRPPCRPEAPAVKARRQFQGAFRIDPSRLRHSPRIAVPDDVEIVLYSSSRRELVSARAAVALKRIGVENVWVLEGGLDSWRKKGLPLSQFPDAPVAVAEQLGVRLPDA
jgi:rhodanese-related sulfurtransferase